tara:strand:- start:6323 stop:7075 length:753 start_codon:yes stop_codon:yes gene_type:complete
MPRSNRLEETEAEEPKATEETSDKPQPRARKTRASSSAAKKSSTTTRSRRTTAAAKVDDSPNKTMSTSPALLRRYRDEVKISLGQEFKYKNVMEIPSVRKVTLNIGLGESKTNARAMESAIKDITSITGQKPVTTRARKSIAGFKLREGEPIGVAVTLRGNRMYDFLDRLFNASLPRIRDFRGVSRKAFDGHGNYSLGLREQIMFPEIDYGQIDRIRGMQISIVTSAKTDAEGMRLLELMGLPFARTTNS